MENEQKPVEPTPPQYAAPARSVPPPLRGAPAVSPASGAKRGRGWMIVAIALFCALGVSLLLNMAGFVESFTGVAARQTAGPNLMEVLVEDYEGGDKIAVLSIEGIISSGDYNGTGFELARLLREQLKRAKEDKKVKAVVLRIDSPGGEVLASDAIYHEIESFQEESRKPVVASMGSLAASGGYYVAAPCRWIVAHEVTITGSIGVIMQGFNYRGLMNKVGLRPEVYKSGKFKDMLSGSRDLDNLSPAEKEAYKEERAMVQGLIDETYGRFKDVVKKGRDKAAKANRADNLKPGWEEYADGRILSGRQARELGFVDETGTFDDAVKRAARLAGIPGGKLVTYATPFNFANLFRLLGKAEPPTLKVDLGLEAPPIKNGRMYFLSPVLTF